MLLRTPTTLLLFAAASLTLQAQTPAPPPDTTRQQAQTPAYTFHAAARVVLTDITVQDAHGNPVLGLTATAFHLTDNKHPQPISTFEEHVAPAPAPAVVPVSAPGVFSNEYLLHPPPVLNILLIDIANLNLPDQMYLYYELTRFLKNLPAGQSLALYLRAGNGCFLIQNFTPDRELLLAGVHKAIPRFLPHDRDYLSDTDLLRQMAVYLDNLPGRKNILWFSGGSTAYLNPENYDFQQQSGLRYIYDELQRERIAVYPIDARGLTLMSGPMIWDQHGDMTAAAAATGGQAFYDSNGIDLIASRVISTDGSYYTLTYTPGGLHYDNKWHKVRITVDGGNYRLSYRHGYFADGSLAPAATYAVSPANGQQAQTRTRLLADGEKRQETLYSIPIIFSATVLPSSDPNLAALPKPSAVIPPGHPERGTHPVSLRYSLPVDNLTGSVLADGKRHLSFGLAAIVLNRDGRPVQRRMEGVTMAVNEEMIRHNPTAPIAIDQQLYVHNDDEYLFLAVWDKSSNRTGTLQVTLQPEKKK